MFDSGQLDTARERRLRGIVLELVWTNHRQQRAHMDSIMLWGLLDKVGFGVGQNDVLTVLQDLKDRTYLEFDERQNRFTRRTEISRITITAKGRDLVEHTEEDKAVLIP